LIRFSSLFALQGVTQMPALEKNAGVGAIAGKFIFNESPC
jgi:hypothetical protein